MATKKLLVTDAQLNAIVNAADILSAMRGGIDADVDKEFEKTVKGIDAFLRANNLARKHK